MADSLMQEIAEEAGLNPRSYSGRGMFGKQCLAITTDANPFLAMAQLIESARQNTDPDQALEDLQDALSSASMDQMGLGTVIYFKDIPFTMDDSDDKEFDPEELNENS